MKGFWTAENLAQATGGAWVRSLAEGDVDAGRAVSTDSRSVGRGQVFFALRGERFDGHEFVREALAEGAAAVVVEDGELARAAEGAALVVSDARRALGDIAQAYRRRLTGTRVIAVTGSNGKTTTARMIGILLSSKFRGRVSEKSFNNDVGAPLTLLGAQLEDEFLVCEVGANAPGEIARLGEIVAPDVAVITSVGRAHLEGFGDVVGVAREKARLFDFVRDGGLRVATGDSIELRAVMGDGAVLVGEGADADVRVSNVRHEVAGELGLGIVFDVEGIGEMRAPVVGRHNAVNLAMAAAVGERLGLSAGEIVDAARGIEMPEMRMSWERVGGVWVLNDGYNANPDSMRAAIETFGEVAGLMCGGKVGRGVAVIGDMLEGGRESAEAHREVGRLIGESGVFDRLVAVGKFAGDVARGAAEVNRGMACVEIEDVAGEKAARAAGVIAAGDIALVKGSRSVGLERVVAQLGEGRDAGAGDQCVSEAVSSR